MSDRRTVMLLGGTREAAELARALTSAFDVAVVTSLAGRTRRPQALPGTVRSGGFGGAVGLAAFLEAERIDLLIDATHPFADTISAHARIACDAQGVPRLRLQRPPWHPVAGDRWDRVPDLGAAADRLPALGRRVFLSTGRGGMEAFSALGEHWFLVRLIDRPTEPLPLGAYELRCDRGPFDQAGETALLAEHRIDVVVSKNSGGESTYAKMAAARALALPVVLVDRPPAPAGDCVASVESALSWIGARLAR